jgi:hypothetical protein
LNCLTCSNRPGAPGRDAPGLRFSCRSLPSLQSPYSLLAAACAITLLAVAAPVSADELGDAVAVELKGNESAANSQARIDKIANHTDEMAAEYRATLEEIDGLRTYNAQLDRLITSQDDELTSLRTQIDNVTGIGRQMTPLMIRMLDRLEEFVELDIPLHLEERKDRIARLRKMMDRADVANAEKYRRIMEAYQIENEYGRTVEAYQETMVIDGEERTFDFLSFGRVALVYQSLDGEKSAFWDQATRSWIDIPDGTKNSVRKGVRIARKQAAPDLVRLPIPAPVAASGGVAQ